MKCLLPVWIAVWVLLSCTEQAVQSEDALVEGRALTAADFLSVRLLPDQTEVAAGRRLPLSVLGVLPYGRNADLSDRGSWESSNPEVFDWVKDERALGIALKPGTATITFTYENLTATAQVTVTDRVLDQLHIAPESLEVAIEKIGQAYEERRITMMATGIYSDGSSEDLTQQVKWTLNSEDSLVPLSGKPGVLLTKAPGRTQVTATMDDKVQTRTLDVIQGATVLKDLTISLAPLIFPLQTARSFEITARYSDGTTTLITEAADYALTPAGFGTLEADGSGAMQIVSQTTGSGLLTVQYKDLTQSFNVVAVDAESSLLRLVSGRNFNLAKGEVESFQVWLDTSDGNQENATTRATWRVGNTSILTAVPGTKGRYTAARAGTTTVSATVGSLTVTQTVTISAATVSNIAITAASQGTLGLYQTRDYVATATYSDGTSKAVTADVVWAFLPGTGAGQFDSSVKSRFQGTGMGTGAIKVTLGSVIAQLDLVIGPVVPVALNLQSAWTTLSVSGGSKNLTALVIYSDGSTLDVTSSAEWNFQIVGTGLNFAGYVSNASGSKGACVPLAAGFFKATASYQGLNGEKSIQVLP
ncbi:MAG TPA: hypothetical protein VFO10_06405 [Oligoflexus sp.]|uniref:hypothetical protein n=1 Tax=Oligoflexus sp. TaxID=1971216 RepID=UPI002D7EEBA5|nr:hypothetical protein [Oligoflexus sp.]HET9236862.1 hypothetical protein [Oligoflexus sp.]